MKINKPLVVAESQDFVFDEVHVTGGASGNLTAVVSFVVNDEEGNRIDTKVINYTGEAFNEFWDGFDSGKYLYEELVAKEELDVVVPDAVEENFINASSPVVEATINNEVISE